MLRDALFSARSKLVGGAVALVALLLRFLVAEAVSWSSCLLLTSSDVKDYAASLRLTQELQLSR